MNQNILIGIIIVIVIIIGGVALYSGTQSSNPTENATTTVDIDNDGAMEGMENPATSSPSTTDVNVSASTSVNVGGSSTGTVKTITVEGSNFKFMPSEIRVKKGDTVKIVFKNSGGFHDFVIDEFNVRTKQIQGGSQETVQFVATKAGTFEYYCSVGEHRQMGMKGNLIVE